MKPQAVKGTHDILASQLPAWRFLEETARTVLTRGGVTEIRTPVFEHTEVFVKTAGESSDLVVQKEMYTFEDRGGRSLTLRPEFTPGLLRAYIQHGMHTLPAPVRLWSFGPVFRAENVQRGRFRQFHQLNVEVIGLDSPLVDAEAITLLYDILAAAGLKGLTVKVGSVGDPDERAAYNAYLRAELEPRTAELSPTSQERLRLNPMRLLDAKDPGDRHIVSSLKRPIDFLSEGSRQHLEKVTASLTEWDVPFEVDPDMVRGLDYYRRTAFEIHHGSIGAQSALAGGGRYDGLIASLGGPDVPGFGWAFGVERVLDALQQDGVQVPDAAKPVAYLIPLDDEAVGEVATASRQLRRSMAAAHGYARRNPGKGMRDADRSGAQFAVLRGEQERADGLYQVKHLTSGEQHAVAEDSLEQWLLAREGAG